MCVYIYIYVCIFLPEKSRKDASLVFHIRRELCCLRIFVCITVIDFRSLCILFFIPKGVFVLSHPFSVDFLSKLNCFCLCSRVRLSCQGYTKGNSLVKCMGFFWQSLDYTRCSFFKYLTYLLARSNSNDAQFGRHLATWKVWDKSGQNSLNNSNQDFEKP